MRPSKQVQRQSACDWGEALGEDVEEASLALLEGEGNVIDDLVKIRMVHGRCDGEGLGEGFGLLYELLVGVHVCHRSR